MTNIEDFAGASLVITRLYAEVRAALPSDKAREALDRIVSAPVLPERVSEFFELGYAVRESLSASQRAEIADVGRFAWMHGFWGLGENNRGSRMETLLRGGNLPASVDAPEISAKYVDLDDAPASVPGE